MPALQNARHEAYAQLLAKGWHQGKAYKEAGFSNDRRSSASMLARKAHIRARIDEILVARAEAEKRAFVAVSTKFELSRQWVIDKLVKNCEIALAERPVQTRSDGLEYRYDGAVAARSLELLGREVGLFVEKKQIDITADVRKLSDAELLAQIRETAGELLELTAETVEPEELNSFDGAEDDAESKINPEVQPPE
jgi:phage terminase small subunit